jgi:hypothetical protein
MKYPKCSLSLGIVTVGVILGMNFRDELFSTYVWTLAGLTILVPLSPPLSFVALPARLALSFLCALCDLLFKKAEGFFIGQPPNRRVPMLNYQSGVRPP